MAHLDEEEFVAGVGSEEELVVVFGGVVFLDG